MSSMDVSSLTKKKLERMFLEGIRFDGRSLEEFREMEISFDVSNKAEGSARVKMGKTEVVAGVKMQVGEPYPDSPDKGNLMVSGDLLPLASPRFESGPPGFDAIELPRLVDRAIRASEMIDLSRLVIKEGEKVWTVMVDIYPINDDGNLIDAATIASLLALRQTHIPFIDQDGKIDYKKESQGRLHIEKEVIPLSLSFFKLGKSILLDPTREEEEACDTRVTWGISKINGEYMTNSCQKKGEAPVSQDDVAKMMELLPKKYEQLNEKLKSYL